VIIARDINVKKIKGAYPQLSEKQRLKAVQKAKGVNKAVLGYKFNRYKIIKEWKPEVICLGYDQKQEVLDLQEKLKELKVVAAIYRLKPFQSAVYKSSIIKRNGN
jgi:FAD synthetase